tara:strand:+ start:861 stop:1511 length:651 start_codon:yes stop_codon:yes gene_type:complete
MSDIKCALLKPFGSTILKSELPDDLVKEFLNDLNTIRSSPEKLEGHKFGHKLAGNLYKELLVSHPVMLKWKQKYFDTLIVHYATSHYKEKKVKQIIITASWHNIQKSGDFNPCHTHTHFQDRHLSPDISTVGYIKLPKSMVDYKHSKQHHAVGGHIEFVEGTEDMFTNANYLIQPMVKDFYIFPSSLRHAVYPFYSDNETDERISFSFNAKIIFDE